MTDLTAKQVVERWAAREQTAERYPHLRICLDVLLREYENQATTIRVYEEANRSYLARIRQLEAATLEIFSGPVDEMSPERFQMLQEFNRQLDPWEDPLDLERAARNLVDHLPTDPMDYESGTDSEWADRAVELTDHLRTVLKQGGQSS